MKTTYLDQFCELSIYQKSHLISKAELKTKKKKLENEISKQEGCSKLCLLEAADGLDFCLKFLALLDSDFIPLAVGKDSFSLVKETLKQSYSGFITWEEGEFIEYGKAESLDYKNTYACITSGTTSKPKLCFLSIEGAKLNARAHAKSLQISQEHMVVQSLPLYHSYGLVAYLWTSLEIKNSLNLFPHFLGFKSLRKITHEKQALSISPGQLRFLLREKNIDSDSLNQIKIISVGGGLADSYELEQLQKKVPSAQIFVTYGLTEAGPRVLTGQWNKEAGSSYIGNPIADTEIAVLQNNKVISEGEGILLIKGPSVKSNTLDSELFDGWLISRDRVEIRNDQVYFISRENDLIKVGGISVYPKDIEAICRLQEAVEDCLVLKKNDKLYGEIPIIFVEGNLKKNEIIDFMKAKLTVNQMPKEFYILNEFPRHSLGKINRKKIQGMVSYE